MSQVFVSYKREEREKAQAVAEAIAAAGYDVWWDINLLPGDRFADEIKEGIRQASAVVVLWSAAAGKSDFVLAEASLARELGRLVPVNLDGSELPFSFGGLHTLDLSAWRGSATDPLLQPLVKAVSQRVQANRPSAGKPDSKNTSREEVAAPSAKRRRGLEMAMLVVLILAGAAGVSTTFMRTSPSSDGAPAVTSSVKPPPPGRVDAVRASLWPSKVIAVCWESDPAGFAPEAKWVQQAISLSWARYSPMVFTGWGRCADDSKAVRISVQDVPPHVRALGVRLRGMKDGVVLNFTFAKWMPSCREMRETCIRALAVHEFGHVLGLAHENSRPDVPADCRVPAQGEAYPAEFLSAPYDADSVMNYCNGLLANHGVLSTGDRKRIHLLYGGGGT